MTQESVNAIGVSIPPTLLARADKAESPLGRSVFCAAFRVPYRPGPGGLSFRNEFQKLARQARLRSGLASGLFFHRGRASPSLRHQTLQKFKNKLPFRTNPDLASRPISQAHESATDHTKGPGHDLVRTLHRERHDALRTLPPAGQLMLIRDLRDFLDRQEQEIHRRQRARRPEVTSI